MFLVLIFAIAVTLLVAWFCYKSMKPVSHASRADSYVDKEIILSIKEDKFLRTEKRKKEKK